MDGGVVSEAGEQTGTGGYGAGGGAAVEGLQIDEGAGPGVGGIEKGRVEDGEYGRFYYCRGGLFREAEEVVFDFGDAALLHC